MKVEEITLKRLKTERDYLLEIFIKYMKSTYKNEEERLKLVDSYYDEALEKAKQKVDIKNYEELEGINLKIADLEIENEAHKYAIKKYVLQSDDINEVIEIDNLVMGKVVAKKAGKTSVKYGKFLGKKAMDGAINLYKNRDEILDKVVTSVQEKQDKNHSEYEKYKRRYANFSSADLKEIVLDESYESIKRRAAKELYNKRQKKES